MKSYGYVKILYFVILVIIISACRMKTTPPPKEQPVHIQSIEGSPLSSIELTEKAAKRLDLQTTQVKEENIIRKRTFGGRVVGTEGSTLIRIALSESDLEKVDPDYPAIVWPIDGEKVGWKARFVDSPDPAETAKVLYCLIDTPESHFMMDQRVLVELSTLGYETHRLLIPYSAVLYDVQGKTWVYVQTDHLTYERASIIVDYIDSDQAVLADGPPAGTQVVIAGASELFGAESGVGGGH